MKPTRRCGRTTVGSAVVIAVLVAAGVLAVPAAQHSSPPRSATDVRAYLPITTPVQTLLGFLACGPVPLGQARCGSEVVKAAATLAAEPHAGRGGQPAGFAPADLQSAYGLTAAAATQGAGRTVAVVVAYDNPNVETDLAMYRATFGLPPCTGASGCFSRVDQNGGHALPVPDVGWGTETDIDVQMVSATCPLCHILLVEAGTAHHEDLGTAVNTAAHLGAAVISNSYGGRERPNEIADDARFYRHQGIAVVASSGDSGGAATQYPASSPDVTAVGGTTLTRGGGARGWSESAWPGSGNGCSAFEPRPVWQANLTACATRSVADVAAVADPHTGAAVYDSFGASPGIALLCQVLALACPTGGWEVVGGTSVSAPIIAATYALAGNPVVAGSYPYQHAASLNTIAGGYRGPTGLGTPAGVGGF